MPTLLSKKLAAKMHQRQIEALVRISLIETVLDKQAIPRGRQVFEIATSDKSLGQKLLEFSAAMQLLIGNLKEASRKELIKLVAWSHRSAIESLLDTVPQPWLLSKIPRGNQLRMEYSPPKPIGWLDIGYGELRIVGEEEFSPFDVPVKPLIYKRLTKDQKDEVLKKILFPAPSAKEVTDIIGSTGWEDRFAALSRLINDSRALFSELVTGYAAGENLQGLKKRALDLVGGVQSSAKRIVRTEGMRVAETIQRRSWEPLGDLMIGAQVIAVLDERTRPEHATRNGQVYYKEPKAGQKSISELPDLPDGPNCRCMSVPVLSPPDELQSDPLVKEAFKDLPGVGIPDPETHEKWFAGADPSRRKLAVGVGRYTAMQKILGDTRQPEWSDFVDQEGQLLSVDALANETIVERVSRKQAMQILMAERGRALQNLAKQGFLMPE